MGARPVALLNALRFGSIENNKTKYLLEGLFQASEDTVIVLAYQQSVEKLILIKVMTATSL